MRLKDDEKTKNIYRAAIEVINSEGFEGSSMSKIAKLSDISPATIYLYFDNKDDLLKKLYIEMKSRMGNSYFTKDMNLSATKATFRTLWLNHYQYITENIDAFTFIENFANCPLIKRIENEYNLDYCPTFEQLFEQAKTEKLIMTLDNDIIYSQLFAPINHLVKKAKANFTAISLPDLIQIFECSWKSISY